MQQGSIRGRRGSELKVLSAVETKMAGYFAQVREMAACRVLKELRVMPTQEPCEDLTDWHTLTCARSSNIQS